MKFINLTNHFVNVQKVNGEILDIPPCENPAKVEYDIENSGVEGDINIVKRKYKYPINLPEPREGVRYIVSLPVASMAQDRTDLLIPQHIVWTDKDKRIAEKCRALAYVQ